MKSLKNILLLLGNISLITARTVNFSVIAFCNTNAQLNINGGVIDMTKDDPAVPLWKVSSEVGDGELNYNYICDGTPETVKHVLGKGETTTHNELFDRENTIYTLPKLGYPNTKPWDRSIGQTELFDETYIPTFVFYGYGNFFVKGSGSQTFSKVVAILKDNVYQFDGIPSSGKNGDEDKFQFRITLPEPGIYHRTVLKFRPSSYDPAFFRQILYGDILHAIGNPAHESVAARVYQDDGTGIGLYVLQEDCTTESFIRATFYGNEENGSVIDNYDVTPIYDCATGADFNYYDTNYLGAFINNTYDLKIELKEMTRQVDILDVNNESQVKNLDENWLELDTLLRALAVEYLAGHWDSYWFLSSNFITYHPSDESEIVNGVYNKYKYYFIDQDFDQTFGIGMSELLSPETFPTKSYKEFLRMAWGTLNPDDVADSTTRIIVDKLIGCNTDDKNAKCATKTYFESHLKSIVQHIFNPVSLGGRIDAYAKRLRPEIIWDTEVVVRQHVGTKQLYHFTVNDFDGNIESGNYLGSLQYWGIKDWLSTRANSICSEFNFEYDKVALTPETAANYTAQDITADKPYNPQNQTFNGNNNLNNSGASTISSFLLSSFVISLITLYLLI